MRITDIPGMTALHVTDPDEIVRLRRFQTERYADTGLIDDGSDVHFVGYPLVAVPFVAQPYKVEIEPVDAQARRLQMVCPLSLAALLL